MSRARLSALLGIFALLAIAFAVRSEVRLRALREEPASLRRRKEALEREVQSLEKARKESLQRAADQARANEIERASSTEAVPAAAPAPGAPPQNLERLIATNPAFRARYLQLFKQGINDEWGLLIAALKLSPDDAEKFRNLMVQRRNNDLEVQALEAAQDVSEETPNIQQVDDQMDAANRAAIAELLGQQGYKAWSQYHRDENVLPVVGQIAAEVSSNDTPLSVSQAMQLTKVLAAASSQNGYGKVIGGTLDWDQAAINAQSILSPEQMSVFTLFQEQAQSTQALNAVNKSILTGTPLPPGP